MTSMVGHGGAKAHFKGPNGLPTGLVIPSCLAGGKGDRIHHDAGLLGGVDEVRSGESEIDRTPGCVVAFAPALWPVDAREAAGLVKGLGMPLAPIKLTFDEYCALPVTNQPHELVDGELRTPAAPHRRHQEVSANIHEALRHHVRSGGLGRVLYAPVDVVLDRDRPLVVQPDLLFVSADRRGILAEKVYGAPDLVIEVLSPGAEMFDRTERAVLYGQYGVRGPGGARCVSPGGESSLQHPARLLPPG